MVFLDVFRNQHYSNQKFHFRISIILSCGRLVHKGKYAAVKKPIVLVTIVPIVLLEIVVNISIPLQRKEIYEGRSINNGSQ